MNKIFVVFSCLAICSYVSASENVDFVIDPTKILVSSSSDTLRSAVVDQDVLSEQTLISDTVVLSALVDEALATIYKTYWNGVPLTIQIPESWLYDGASGDIIIDHVGTKLHKVRELQGRDDLTNILVVLNQKATMTVMVGCDDSDSGMGFEIE